MPKIAEFDNPFSTLKPQETGPEALARSGRIIEAQYNAAGAKVGGAVSELGKKIEDHQTQTDILAGHAEQNKNTLDAQQDLQNTPDMDNPEVLAKWREKWGQKFDDTSAKYSSTPRSTESMGLLADAHKMHVFEQSGAASMGAANNKAVASVMESQNALSNLAAGNLASLPFALGQAKQQVEDIINANPGMSAEAKSQLRTVHLENTSKAIAKAGLDGLVHDHPEVAEQYIKNLPPEIAKFVDGAAAVRDISSAKHLQRQEAMQARSLALQEQRQSRDSEAARIANVMHNPNASFADLQAVPQAIDKLSKQPGVNAGMIDHLWNIRDGQQKARDEGSNIPNDPTIVDKLWEQAGAGTLSVPQIVAAEGTHQINGHTADMFYRRAQLLKSDPSELMAQGGINDLVNGFKVAITKPYNDNMMEGEGANQFMKYKLEFMDRLDKAHRAGITTQEAMTNKSSPYYLGDLAHRYIKDPITLLQTKNVLETAPTMPGTVTPAGRMFANPEASRKPGESMADYDKRTKDMDRSFIPSTAGLDTIP